MLLYIFQMMDVEFDKGPSTQKTHLHLKLKTSSLCHMYLWVMRLFLSQVNTLTVQLPSRMVQCTFRILAVQWRLYHRVSKVEDAVPCSSSGE